MHCTLEIYFQANFIFKHSPCTYTKVIYVSDGYANSLDVLIISQCVCIAKCSTVHPQGSQEKPHPELCHSSEFSVNQIRSVLGKATDGWVLLVALNCRASCYQSPKLRRTQRSRKREPPSPPASLQGTLLAKLNISSAGKRGFHDLEVNWSASQLFILSIRISLFTHSPFLTRFVTPILLIVLFSFLNRILESINYKLLWLFINLCSVSPLWELNQFCYPIMGNRRK